MPKVIKTEYLKDFFPLNFKQTLVKNFINDYLRKNKLNIDSFGI